MDPEKRLDLEEAGEAHPLALSGTGESTPRLPFQLIQHQSGDADDAPLVATPPARQQPPVFFAADPADSAAPKLKSTQQQHSSSSSSQHSQASVIHQAAGAAGAGAEQISSASDPKPLARVSSMGVVRRKSWRTHYVRPNKSLDQESGTPKEVSGHAWGRFLLNVAQSSTNCQSR